MNPIDLPVDVTVQISNRPSVPVTSSNAASPRLTVPSSQRYLLSLSPTQRAVRDFINRFSQVTSSQCRRALYSGTPRGVIARSSRHLKALSERGVIKRLPYKLSGFERGSGELVYAPITSKARIPNLHTLDITDLYVQLVENHFEHVSNMVYLPEPWGWDTWGGVELKPDAYVRVAGRHFMVEVDYETEYASVLSAKMNKYLRAYNSMDGGSFPIVLFTCHTPERKVFIEREIAKKPIKALFKVVLFPDAIEEIIK